jgi:hypothetical protein
MVICVYHFVKVFFDGCMHSADGMLMNWNFDTNFFNLQPGIFLFCWLGRLLQGYITVSYWLLSFMERQYVGPNSEANNVLSNVSQHCKFGICILVFGGMTDDSSCLKNILEMCRHGDMQKAFLVGRSKYLPASPLIDLIVSCKSREVADSHYNLVNCFSSDTFGRCIRVLLREAYFVIHSTKLRLYVVKNLCQLDTALEALWSRLKWLRLIWEPQLALIEIHEWKLCTVKFFSWKNMISTQMNVVY